MTAILALLLSVSATDRADWPPAWEASQQYERCGESIANLRKMRSLVGYEDGPYPDPLPYVPPEPQVKARNGE